MSFTSIIQSAAIKSLSALYGQEFFKKDFQINETKPEFEGDYTIVLFALVKALKKSPEVLGHELGKLLLNNYPELFSSYNVIKGFLNLQIADEQLTAILLQHYNDENYGKQPANQKRVMVEYSSPNTNKPLHLGHLRNIFLGWSVAEI
jgi:arginyl-tRNA synthetase